MYGNFALAGVHLWVDLDTLDTSTRNVGSTWTLDQLQRLFIGNEVINSKNRSATAPDIKAAVADMRAYRDKMGYRTISTRYSAADVAELRPQLQNYLACGDPQTTIEFFGINSYTWNGSATTRVRVTTIYKHGCEVNSSIPIFFRNESHRPTTKTHLFPMLYPDHHRSPRDQAAIFGPEMSDTWSGALTNKWVSERHECGIVEHRGTRHREAPVPVHPGFLRWRNIRPTVRPSKMEPSGYTPGSTTPICTPGVAEAGKLMAMHVFLLWAPRWRDL
ncbi:hypothetical protein EYC84_010361 [Monilinia fructicola]|uniref:1,3-beta-glucanosyltransferase n=1 Tax=Monilinia fructicola TaxID=38448 RepID=A0A5M9JDJ1_MONFR|nr:hypothetical protein EYC84_010361 [Monilinia fructicola]